MSIEEKAVLAIIVLAFIWPFAALALLGIGALFILLDRVVGWLGGERL